MVLGRFWAIISEISHLGPFFGAEQGDYGQWLPVILIPFQANGTTKS